MKKRGFIKLLINILTKPGIAELVSEEGAVGFGVYIMVVLYLAQCDDSEGLYTNGQMAALAVLTKKSRAYIRHIICDYGLFEIEGRRFHELIMTQYSPARSNRYAGEDVEVEEEKEKKEKADVCESGDTHTTEDGTAATKDCIGPSAYERVDSSGRRHGNRGEPVPWWAPPQMDVYKVWSLVDGDWVPPSQIDPQAEQQKQQGMSPRDFMMKTAWEELPESEHSKIQDDAKRQ